MTAKRYYEQLTRSMGREKADARFCEFCAEAYPQFLSDYIHFTRKHINEAEAIKNEALRTFGLRECAASHCKMQRREGRRRNTKHSKQKRCDTDNFYIDIMANAHFLMHHLREYGLRTLPRATTNKETDEEKVTVDDDDTECLDTEFAEKAMQIAQSQKKGGAELGSSNKFTIQIITDAKAKGKGKSTLMDALCAFVRGHGDDVGRDRVLALLGGEHFDSESAQIGRPRNGFHQKIGRYRAGASPQTAL